MSKRTALICYQHIIQKLRKQPSTFKQINDYLEIESQIQGEDLTLTLRTFQRYVSEIRSLYNIEIQFDFSHKVYRIVEDQIGDTSARMLEAFDLFNILNMRDNLGQYILFEQRKAKGSEHIYGLLHAIRNKLFIELTYQKFGEENPLIRSLKPLALKEFKGRWYLLATEVGAADPIKSFGLDRIIDFSITPKTFQADRNINIRDAYANCFGILNPREVEPQRIVLSFSPIQGKFVHTYPLHNSQRVILSNETEYRIELFLKITYDFISELLSFRDEVKVISPNILKEQIKKVLVSTMNKL